VSAFPFGFRGRIHCYGDNTGNGTKYLRKSRYAGIDCYLGNDRADDTLQMAELHNDMQIETEQGHVDRYVQGKESTVYVISFFELRVVSLSRVLGTERHRLFLFGDNLSHRLLLAGVDGVLARHVAHLFARDPLVIFADRVNLDDRTDVDHWENLQSTNWQSVLKISECSARCYFLPRYTSSPSPCQY